MFNDRYGLTQAVLDGRKTQTRRIVSQSLIDKYDEWYDDVCCIARPSGSVIETLQNWLLRKHTRFYVGEVVAVAQSYVDCGNLPDYELDEDGYPIMPTRSGFFNKMFVRAELMPNQIRITNVRIERLQDISDADCLKEGIYAYYYGDEKEKRFYEIPPNGYSFDGTDFHYPTPREAFAYLIDKVSDKGTWERNPYVWVYDFELVK